MEESIGTKQEKAKKAYCNCCGREIRTVGKEREDYLQIDKTWGYFSKRDLTRQAFNLCESCYDKLIKSFKIPVEECPAEDLYLYTDDELQMLKEAYAKQLNK